MKDKGSEVLKDLKVEEEMKHLVHRRERFPFELVSGENDGDVDGEVDGDEYDLYERERDAILFADEHDDSVMVIATSVPQQRRRMILFLVVLMISVASFLMFAMLTSTTASKAESHPLKSEKDLSNMSINPMAAPTTSPTKTTAQQTQSPTNSPSTQSPTTQASTVKYYSIARTDRAGAAIKEMYLGHAHAFATNTTYGGACVEAIDWDPLIKKHGEKFRATVQERVKERKQLIKLLGLETELPMACPTKQELKEKTAVIWKNRNKFKTPGFTTDWVKYIQSKTLFPYAPRNFNTVDPIQIVIHMRRGDMTPCFSGDRYLPNVYFQKAIDFYIPKYCSGTRTCNVTIYTEANAYEPLDEFQHLNLTTLDVTTTPPTIWKDIVNADVFMMSMSAFSFIPGILNRNGNVITPYGALPFWVTVDNGIWWEAYLKRNELAEQCPPK